MERQKSRLSQVLRMYHTFNNDINSVQSPDTHSALSRNLIPTLGPKTKGETSND